MLTSALTHPQLLAAAASAGHGARVLIADGNYPFSTGVRVGAPVVYLNLRPGMLTVSDVLAPLLEVLPVEGAAVMGPADEVEVPAHAEYRATLGPDVPIEVVGRADYYALSRSQDVAFVVATADVRLFASVMLTVGVR